MSLYESERNLLEKLADAIPGLKGYRDKEARRDTDKRYRDYLAGRIDGVRNSLEDIKREMVESGNLEELDDVDRITQKLFRAAAAIRHASYGYSGFFDQVKIQEAELDRLYQYDLSLVTHVEAVEQIIRLDPTLTIREQKKQWEEKISSLEKRIEERKNLFTISGS